MVTISELKFSHVILGSISESRVLFCQFSTFCVDFDPLECLFSIFNIDDQLFQLLVSTVTI
jgi:hypothetical protein